MVVLRFYCSFHSLYSLNNERRKRNQSLFVLWVFWANNNWQKWHRHQEQQHHSHQSTRLHLQKEQTLQLWPTKLSWAGYKDGQSMQNAWHFLAYFFVYKKLSGALLTQTQTLMLQPISCVLLPAPGSPRFLNLLLKYYLLSGSSWGRETRSPWKKKHGN